MFTSAFSTTSTPSGAGGGGLFGGGGAGGGLFGGGGGQAGGIFSPTTGTTTTTGGGLFGGGSFGSSSQPQGGQTGLFSPIPASNNVSQFGGGGLFGSPQPSSQFGGLFGQQQQQQQGGGLFSPSGNTTSTSLFGSSGGGGNAFGTRSLFGGNAPLGGFGQPQQQQQPPIQYVDVQAQAVAAAANTPWWYKELLAMQSAYRLGQHNKFQTMLYEVVPVAPDLQSKGSEALVREAKEQRKRAMLSQYPWMDVREWHRMEEANPDPSNWMPTLIVGIDQLHTRVALQRANVREQLQMTSASSSSAGVAGNNDAANGGADEEYLAGAHRESQMLDEALERCREQHAKLVHRFVGVMGRLERLQIRNANTGSRLRSEIEFHEELKSVKKAADDPLSGCRARLDEVETLYSRATELARRRRLGAAGGEGVASSSSSGVGVSDFDRPEEDLTEEERAKREAVLNYLDAQTTAVEKLLLSLKRDAHDVGVIAKHAATSTGNQGVRR